MGHLRKRISFVILLSSVPAWAADMNLSGRYLDPARDPVIISQAGASLSVTPDTKDLPQQARQFLGDVKLTGAIETPGEKRFSMDASYQNTIEPMPGMKLKLNVDFDASGEQVAEGLVMKSCEWKLDMTVFSSGEIAGSESHSEKCVGLWKKQ